MWISHEAKRNQSHKAPNLFQSLGAQSHLLFWMGIIFACAGILAVSSRLHAQVKNPAETARVRAMGGASYAFLNIQDSLYQNPAVMAFEEFYSINASVVSDDNDQDAYVFSAVDGSAELFAGGFGYLKNESRKRLDFSASDNLAKNIALGFGVTHWDEFQNEESLTSLRVGSLYVGSFFTAGLGFSGLVGDADRLNRAVDLGVSFFTPRIVTASLSAKIPLESEEPGETLGEDLRGGLEFDLSQGFALRAGYRRNELSANYDAITYGAGWRAPKISFDFAFEDQESLDESLSADLRENPTSSFSMTIFF
jgi:hypothetical protein